MADESDPTRKDDLFNKAWNAANDLADTDKSTALTIMKKLVNYKADQYGMYSTPELLSDQQLRKGYNAEDYEDALTAGGAAATLAASLLPRVAPIAGPIGVGFTAASAGAAVYRRYVEDVINDEKTRRGIK